MRLRQPASCPSTCKRCDRPAGVSRPQVAAGPTGTGALYVGSRAEVGAWREGGTGGDSASETQPKEFPYFLEGGTPNVLGVAGLSAGIEFVQSRGLEAIRTHETELTERLWQHLDDMPEFHVFGHRDRARRIGTLSFRDRPIHVLITDIVMPGLGGLELAKSALELRPTLSVVLVSGYTDRALDREAISFAKFLQKPFSFDALARTVRSLLDKNREILLIEDSKFMRVAVQSALNGAGYTVHTTDHGEAGLRAARETLPDVIVLDLVLPTTSGLDVLKALKRDAITKSIPVIVLAALSEPTKEELLNEGAAACVENSDKLLENDSVALIHTVTQVLGKAKASRG